MAVGGVDTYYDYDEKQWKSRRLGGGPIRREPVCPKPATANKPAHASKPIAASHPKKAESTG
jgi:hypothetical protein